MGNRFSRRREAPANGAETTATEQKPAEEPVATQQAEAPQIPEVVEAEKPAAAVEEPVAASEPAAVVSEPVAESVPEPEAPAAAPLVDVTPEPVAEEVVAPPPEPEPLVSVCEPPAPEAVVEPEPIPEPVVEPEPVAEPEPEPEPVLEPEPEPVPTLEPEIDLLTQESLPEPLLDLGVPDLTPIDTPSSAIPDEPADLPGIGDGIIEAAVNSMPVPEESKESWESLEKPLEPESVGAGNVEQLLCDVSSEVTDSGLLKHSDLTGNDLVNDLIPNDINIPDDIPIANMTDSSELM